MSNIVEIGEFRATRIQSYERKEGCKHWHFTIDRVGDVVTCDDCDQQISAIWALELLCDSYSRGMDKVQRERQSLAKTQTTVLHLKAARQAEEAWRSRTMAPCCPHCGEAIFANDGFGRTQVNKDMAQRRREVMQASKGAQP